ncbi:aldo/keto reductase [Chloroflexi bacterium TSY]|nr:aldo/keto reductase [Chloroflexi bacterium TSY]
MIEKRPFGRTDHMSTATLFGGVAVGRATQDEADQILELLFKYGVNHIDTAAGYGDSELRIGKWMKQHRGDFFLATKTGERTYAKAKEQIHKSLKRLQTDHVDLIQLHSLSHPDEWEVALGEGGALEAAIEAREQGLVRFIGVTGHGWNIAAMHKRSLGRFDFDSVLLPYSYIMHKNGRYRNDFDEVVSYCEEGNIAVQTIKAIARGPWATAERTHNPWYQPLVEQEDIDRGVHWVLGRPNIFLNTAGDMELLPKLFDAASRFEARPSDVEMEAMVAERKLTSIFGI